MTFILNRLKAIILAVIGAFRRALCCFRSRRRSHENDQDCLTDVGVVPNRIDQNESSWDNQWCENPISRPQTIQDHIQMYREKIAQPPPQDDNRDERVIDDLFQELTPQYIKQKRIIIGDTGPRARSNESDMSRLSVSESNNAAADLGEWMEDANSGWDEQHLDPMDILKEQKRMKKENRTQQQHHQQNVRIGKKLKT